MGLFGKPKCPFCGGSLERTYAAFPCKQWRCNSCIARSREKKKTDDRIKALEKKIAELQNK